VNSYAHHLDCERGNAHSVFSGGPFARSGKSLVDGFLSEAERPYRPHLADHYSGQPHRDGSLASIPTGWIDRWRSASDAPRAGNKPSDKSLALNRIGLSFWFRRFVGGLTHLHHNAN
jgi:hypothetical protein